ncbi:hypothetical protein J7L60_01860 [Candidatus Bathyarchaeota archaeon]|nr:hypothetical protein [Candidatus Bathyarchaeota archaeon]
MVRRELEALIKRIETVLGDLERAYREGEEEVESYLHELTGCAPFRRGLKEAIRELEATKRKLERLIERLEAR